jgi:multiple sugar transport system permease protein
MTSVAMPPSAAPQVLASRPARQKMGAQARREAIIFYVCVAPWIIGFILFTLGPMAVSLVISLTKWNFIQPPTWVGLGNYLTILTDDPDFRQALQVTSFYAVFSIPIRLGAALGLAVLLNETTKGVSFFRTAFYLPTIVASVAAAVLWQFILNPVYGPVNGFLRVFGIEGPHWFTDPSWVPWGLIMMSAWGVGGEMLIFLAGLKGIPQHLYEAAQLDGAGRAARFLNITIPMLSPTLFFNLVMAVIGSFQTFDSAYVISTARAGTLGGPLKSTLFYMIYTYDQFFAKQRVGYGSALGWILFVIILVLTLITLRSSALWVHYEAEKGT